MLKTLESRKKHIVGVLCSSLMSLRIVFFQLLYTAYIYVQCVCRHCMKGLMYAIFSSFIYVSLLDVGPIMDPILQLGKMGRDLRS